MLPPTCFSRDTTEEVRGVSRVSQIGGFGTILGPYRWMYAWFMHLASLLFAWPARVPQARAKVICFHLVRTLMARWEARRPVVRADGSTN